MFNKKLVMIDRVYNKGYYESQIEGELGKGLGYALVLTKSTVNKDKFYIYDMNKNEVGHILIENEFIKEINVNISISDDLNREIQEYVGASVVVLNGSVE